MHLLFFICFVAWHVEDSSANPSGVFFKWNKYSWPSGNRSATNGGGSGRGTGPLPPTSNIPVTARDRCIQSLEILLDTVFKKIEGDMDDTEGPRGDINEVNEAWTYFKNCIKSHVIPNVRGGPGDFHMPSQKERTLFGKDVLCDRNTVDDVRQCAGVLLNIYGNDGTKRQ